MNVIFITYQKRLSATTKAELYEKIKFLSIKHGTYLQTNSSTFFIYTKHNVEDIYNAISSFFAVNDFMFICDITKADKSIISPNEEVDEWLWSHLSS
jgi:hypothetical protein